MESPPDPGIWVIDINHRHETLVYKTVYRFVFDANWMVR